MLSVSAAPILDSAGNIVAGVVVFDDITARKEIEEALEQSNQELRRANQELEQFAYVASHDLREPLRAVNIYSELLLRRMKHGDADAHEFGRFIREGVLRMSAMIDGVLAYSRLIDAGTDPLGAADLNGALGVATLTLAESLKVSGAHIESGPLGTVAGDRDQLSQVFQVLISNASNTAASSTVRCTSGSRASGGVASGSRPSPTTALASRWSTPNRSSVCSSDFTAPSTRNRPGPAICRRIIERDGGRIWAESVLNQGSVFRFALPAALGRSGPEPPA